MDSTIQDQQESIPRYLRWAVPALTVLLVGSLILHVLTIMTLLHVRTLVKDQVAVMAREMEQVQSDVIRVTVPIKYSIPINTQVPIRKELIVPIRTTVKIDNSVTIPLNTPFGETSFAVPIRAEVPVETTVPITLNETMPVSTVVDLDLTIPIELPLSNTPVAGYLERLRNILLQMGAAI